MAKEEVAAAGEEVPKKKGKMMIIIIAVVAVLVIGGGVGAFLLLQKPAVEKKAKHATDEAADEDGHGDAADEEEDDGHGDDEHPPIYVKLEAFTVNLADQESMLQTEMQLLVADAKVSEKLTARLPEVRNALLILLSSKTPDDLSQPDGKTKLALEIQKSINDTLGIKKKSKGVKKVLFGAFIIQ
jgi:flagellar FliL protein